MWKSFVLVSLSTVLMMGGPAAAKAGEPSVVSIHVVRDAGGDRWSSDGAFVDSGVFVDDPGVFAGSSSTYHVWRVFTGDDGTFVARGDVLVRPTDDPAIFQVSGRWAVVEGTGAYQSLHGAGSIAEVFDTGVGVISGSWSGSVQI